MMLLVPQYVLRAPIFRTSLVFGKIKTNCSVNIKKVTRKRKKKIVTIIFFFKFPECFGSIKKRKIIGSFSQCTMQK